ncbi:transposase [Tistlia consotensis]|uniref:Transposase n=2 Tax=Tistlia TaxID=1321364 RepID=A0A1Y6CYG2_9PROT|nr:transposase [Tistlia consotensis]SMF85762.1 transposase [Tistlia consotensis USBA 355]SNS42393.1 transposase [Tistlia consotensis]
MSDPELMPVPEPVRRIEVFTGSGRRRRWPEEVKARIVAESYCSESSVCAVARRHGLTPQQLFGWRRLARRGQLALAAEDAPLFAAVVAEPDGGTGAVDPANGEIVVELGGVRLRIGASVPVARAAALIAALQGRA